MNEYLERLRAKKAAALKKKQELLALVQSEDRAMTAEEQNAADQHDADAASLDKTILHTERQIAVEAAAAVAPAPRTLGAAAPAAAPGTATAALIAAALVAPAAAAPAAAIAPVAPRIQAQSMDLNANVPGISMTRLVIAQTLARLDGVNAVAVARHRWGNIDPHLVKVVEALSATGGRRYGANEVAGGGGAGWGTELTTAALYEQDFITYLYAQTVFDKLGFREIPADVTLKGQDGAATGYWVGEGKAIPASAMDFLTVSLSPLKVGALAVITKELLYRSAPSAEVLVRDGLVEASAQRVDMTAFSATAASAGVSPAGLFNGLSVVQASAGTDANGVRQDVAALVNAFITAKNASGLVWVMHPTLAVTLSMMVNEFGVRDFPNITAEGGTFFGYPVQTGHNVGTSVLALVKPSDIYKITRAPGELDIAMSDSATIEQSSAPTGAVLGSPPVAASAVLTSMFQSESVAIKVVRPVNFAKRRAHAAQWISDAAYSLIPST